MNLRGRLDRTGWWAVCGGEGMVETRLVPPCPPTPTPYSLGMGPLSHFPQVT